MKIEQVRQRAGVTEKYVPWAGATPVQWTCRVGCAALVAPAPGLPDIQKISVSDSRPIRAGYEPDRLPIQFASGNCPRSIAKIFSQIEKATTMSKFKIDHSASRIRQAKIQASIDQSIADDIQLMSEWSDNEPKYIINQLLRFALAQEEEFQKYKTNSTASAIQSAGNSKAAPTSIKAVSEPAAKPDMTASSAANRA